MTTTTRQIATSCSDITELEQRYVLDALSRGWISQGKYVEQLEHTFAELCNRKYAVVCSSGTAALHLALLALGVGKDHHAIIPAMTYIATANAAEYCICNLWFCDIDGDTWCIDPNQQRAMYDYIAYRQDPSKIITLPVHLYDTVARVDLLKGAVVEDCAHVPGYAGSDSLACYSFYASKIIACGEGGVVTTNDEDLAKRLKLYRGQGATQRGKYLHSVVGYNYRMTDLQAAVACAQVERFTELVAKRAKVIAYYRELLADNTSGITLQKGTPALGWTFAVLLPERVNRDMVIDKLASRGVETRPFFEPLPCLPPYLSQCPPVATKVARQGVCLPTHTKLEDGDIDYVVHELKAAVDGFYRV